MQYGIQYPEGPSVLPIKRQVLVCVAGNCAYDGEGGLEVYRNLRAQLAERGLLHSDSRDEGNVSVTRVLCTIGCGDGPMVVVQPDNVFYAHVAQNDIPRIIDEHLVGDRVVGELYYFRGASTVPLEIPEKRPMWLGGPDSHHPARTGKTAEHHHDDLPSHHSEPRPGNVMDLVCGMSVDPSIAQPKFQHVHEGTRYFFCSPGCKGAFAKSPATYLDPSYRPSM